MDAEDPDAKATLLGALLPVLRVYCIWIATCRNEIVGAPDVTANVIPPMAQSLATVLTLLCAEVYNTSTAPASCPYLLSEDVEMRGLETFSDERVPAPCRGYCTEDGTLKPHLESEQHQFGIAQESMARILDILRSAYFLAEDQVFPLACGVVENQLAFQYQPICDKAAAQNGSAPSQSIPPVVGANVASHKQSAENGRDQTPATPRVHIRQASQEAESRHVPLQTTAPHKDDRLESMDAFDETVANVLSPFIDCPSPKSEQNARSPDEPSYGMHSTTANEVAQELLKSFQRESHEPTPYYESFSPGQFGNSTWNNYFTPTPPKVPGSGSTQHGGLSSYQRHSLNSSRGSANAGEALGDPFVTPGRTAVGSLQPPIHTSSTGSPRAPTGGLQPGQSASSFQSFGGSTWGVPRPPSGSWNQGTNQTPIGQRSSTASGPSYYPPGFPASSNVSAFSHPSSLYQGTPANINMNHGGNAYGNYGNAHMSNGTSRPSPSRHLRMENTASSYDAAIFQAALEGQK